MTIEHPVFIGLSLALAAWLLVRALTLLGITRIRDDDTIHWPISVAPLWVWCDWRYIRAQIVTSGWFYVFRNKPGVIKWEKGRLLPRRWGFGIAGLIEFGDRG